MPLYLYDLPNWLLGLLITCGWMLLGIVGFWIARRLRPRQFDEGEKNVAMALLAVIATVNSLLLAFLAISVWEAYGTASATVHSEANSISALGRDLAVYRTPDADRARELLRSYARLSIDQEWADMRRGRVSDEARAMFDSMFRAVSLLQPQTERHAALMPEIWARTNELLKQRRDRLYAAEAQVPETLWFVVIVGTLMTIAATYVLPWSRFNLSVIGALSFSMGLVFFFIIAMDRPFAGKESIDAAPFELTLRNMLLWDVESFAEHS